MIRLNLQFFGGRGGAGSLSKGSGQRINIVGEPTDVWSYRHNPDNAPFVDQINEGVRDIERDFPDVMDGLNKVNAVQLGGKDNTGVLGYYSYAEKTLGMNINYTDVDKMNRTYDAGVADKFHPSRGKVSGTKAVTYHELGHTLTEMVARKEGVSFDDAAAKLVKDAYKTERVRGGNKGFARNISGYAAKNYAECVAEAVCDYYCNGTNAHNNSKAIMFQLNNYTDKEII